ncbi:MAG TPA: SURF1 family protein [Microbacteriaceae bacterium]|nr:SURF1 family protein [Microbacteriaceae bacterium]
MHRWHFVFSRRWFVYIACAIVFAIACGFLSHWQLTQSRDAQAANRLVARNFDSSVTALTDLLPRPGTFRADMEWRRVRATGSYEPQNQLIVRNRPTDAGPGFEVLTPFRLADGAVFIVDRGWVPVGTGDDPAPVAAPPEGTVSVTMRLKPGEPALKGRSVIGDQIPSIDLPWIRRHLGETTYTAAYGLLQSQTPKPAHSLTAVSATPPTQNTGMYWSYMIQWLIFAAIAFFGVGYAARSEYRRRYQDEPDMVLKEQERQERAGRRKLTDAEIEDALLEESWPPAH